KALGELVHLRLDRARYVERVRLERLKSANPSRRLAVERENLAVGLGAQLDPRHIAQVHHPPVLFGLDDDVFELIDLVEARGNVERVLECLTVRRRRHAQLPCSHLFILSPQRVADVIVPEGYRGELVGYEPYTYRAL